MNNNERSLFNQLIKDAIRIQTEKTSAKNIVASILSSFGVCDEDKYNKFKQQIDNSLPLFEIPEILHIDEEFKKNTISPNSLREMASILSKEYNDKLSLDVNVEYYDFICKMFNFNANDILLDFKMNDERFLMAANKYLDDVSGKKFGFGNLIYNENYSVTNLAKKILILSDYKFNDVMYTNISKFNPNKIYINPTKNLVKNNDILNYWNQIIRLSKRLTVNSKIICAVPDNLLSRTNEADLRLRLLETQTLEGIISLPLKMFTKDSSMKITLLILSKNHGDIKILDATDFIDNETIKNAGLNLCFNLIYERYLESNCSLVPYKKLLEKSSNLTVTNVLNGDKKVYSKEMELSQVAAVLKGNKATETNFYNDITESKTDYLLLMSGNIEDNNIQWDEMKNIVDGSKYDKYYLKENDILLTTKSSKNKVAIASTKFYEKVIVCSSMIIIRVDSDLILPTYLKMFLESPRGQEALSNISRGNAVKTVTLEDISKLKIPCPTIEEQDRMIKSYLNYNKELEAKLKEIKEIKNNMDSLYRIMF